MTWDDMSLRAKSGSTSHLALKNLSSLWCLHPQRPCYTGPHSPPFRSMHAKEPQAHRHRGIPQLECDFYSSEIELCFALWGYSFQGREMEFRPFAERALEFLAGIFETVLLPVLPVLGMRGFWPSSLARETMISSRRAKAWQGCTFRLQGLNDVKAIVLQCTYPQ